MEKYRDTSLPIEERVADLLSRMTLEEKIMQTDQYSIIGDYTKRNTEGRVEEFRWEEFKEALKDKSVGSVQFRSATPQLANELQRYAVEKTRLGIPFLFSEEALHGLYDGHATCFPQQIGLAGTFEPQLGRQMGHAIAAEARACGVHETWNPVMDLSWDPRYGRVEEAFGEDTYLAGEFAREIVKGMQGEDLKSPDTVASEPKHYCGYGTPVGGLNCAPSAMGRHDVFAWALPVFEQAFAEGGAWNAMCSYAAIDGQPVASDHELLTEVLRGRYGMPGFVRSDMTAVARLRASFSTAKDNREAIRQGLEAGVDLQLYDFTHEEWMESIRSLIESGEMAEEVLDTACGRVLKLKVALGLFEHPYVDESLRDRVVNCREHQDLSLDIARKSICLLKNEKRLLPLSDSRKNIAVVGPGADEAALGDYTPNTEKSHTVTVLEGIRQLAGEGSIVSYEKGCSYLGEKVTPFHPGWLTNEDGEEGLTARYYNNWDLSGDPVVTRRDWMVNFNWIYAKPHADVNAECFSVAWTGKLNPRESFRGCIAVPGQDSMRLYIDGELIIDAWNQELGRDSSGRTDVGKEASGGAAAGKETLDRMSAGQGSRKDTIAAQQNGEASVAGSAVGGGSQTLPGTDARANGIARMADFAFQEGREYDIRLEFCNDARGARVVLGYNKGREDWKPALDLVKKADVAIVCLGDNTETSGENLDRTELALPGKQQEFLKEAVATGTPVILVLQNGRPLALSWEEAHVPAILECWFPGEKGGRAIAEVLFGKTYPSGRLPMSFPRAVGQVPCNYNRLPGGGWRYVEMDWNPLYPFGYGLAYTSFAYRDLEIEGDGLTAADVEDGAQVKVSFTVTNTGRHFGEETAQLYIRDLVSSTVKPRKELAGFEKVALNPGESRRVEFLLGSRQMRTLDRRFEWHVEPGEFRVMAGDNSADILLMGEFTVL
ncbi:MAG: beta-glucosidase [Lachnospiraceae bacterium]|jgi:beta-glucosidase-like glycosyl hydrolase|nr:beta-glucosidase [Lachnospiraceae bacterium]